VVAREALASRAVAGTGRLLVGRRSNIFDESGEIQTDDAPLFLYIRAGLRLNRAKAR
jgi:hypothetical protein